MPGSKVNVFGQKKKRKQQDVASNRNNSNRSRNTAVVLSEKSRVPAARVQRAVKALVDYVSRERAARKKQSLLEETETISLIVTLFKTPEQGKNKGIAIPIPHTLHPVEETRVCILVKDDAVKPVKAALEGKLSLGVDKVMSLTKLRTRFADHQKRRELCGSYDLFLADDRILPMLTKALGREFFKHKKQPRPIKVLRRNLEGQIARARDSTRLYLGWGNCSAVRVARTDMSAAEIGANLASAIPEVARHVPQGWRGIQALHIKTPDSVALPLYSHAREADALAAAAVEQEEAEASAAGEGNQVEDKKATKETKAKASKVVAAKKTRGSTKTRGKLAAVDEQPKKAEAMPEIAEEEAEEEQEDVEEPEKEVEPKKKRGRGRRVAELKAATPAKKNVNDKFSPRVTRSMRKKRQ